MVDIDDSSLAAEDTSSYADEVSSKDSTKISRLAAEYARGWAVGGECRSCDLFDDPIDDDVFIDWLRGCWSKIYR